MNTNFAPFASLLLLSTGLSAAVVANAQDIATNGSASASVEDVEALPADAVTIGGDPNTRLPTATVNGDIITGTDIRQRMALFLAGAEQTPNAEQLAQLRSQTLRNLIDEMLQIQEAQAQEMAVTAPDVQTSYSRVAAENFGQDPQQLDTYLASIGSSPASLKRQIEGQIAWQRLMVRNVEPFVNVSAEEVNEVIQRLNESKGLDEYNIAEIYLSATPATAAQVEANATALMEQIRAGGNFQAFAAQYSDASTAASGGVLGWVRLPQIPVEIATEVRSLNPGQIIGPIGLQGGGYSIVYLIDKRQVLTADPRDATVSLKQMTVTFQPGVTQDQAEQRLATFGSGIEQMRGCGDAEAIGEQVGAEVRANDVRVRELPNQLQQAVLDMEVGQVTSPFGSVDEGVSVLVLCGRDDPDTAEEPNFNALMTKLENERVARRGERFLRDLRRDAVIDYN